MFKNQQSYKFSFFLIPFALILLYLGWKKWLVTVPKPLPEQTALAIKSSLNGGSYYEISTSAAKKESYLSADYRIWIPDGVKKIRGLIVKQHGCGDDAAATGLNHANDLQWQALALKHQFALMGTRLPTDYPTCTDKAIANRAAEGSFLKAISILAQKSDRQELNTVPWVMWGHSGGADWGTQMLRHYPERTIAVINVRCGGISLTSGNSEILNLDSNSQSTSPLLKVPVFWFIGDKDPFEKECKKLPQKIFYKFRKANALWALAVQPNAAHETGDSRLLAIPYVDKIISARVTKDSNQLLPIDKTQEWFGDPTTHEIAPINKFEGNPLKAAWLPNEETARKWQEYVTTGKISPTSKPNVPTNVTVTSISATEKVIKWNFTPDLENGLPSFRIYRHNSLIQTLEGQKHNFGDAPEPANVTLEFRDPKAAPDSTYTVAAFNQLGESVSAPATYTKKP